MNKTVIVSLVSALALVACNSAQDASDSNFQKALDAHFQKSCIWIKPSTENGYPVTVDLQQKKNTFFTQAQVDENNANAMRPLEVLVKAGLLTVKDVVRKEKAMFGGDVDVPAKVYDLTDIGRKAGANTGDTVLCIGHYKVDGIIRFTQPGSTTGQTVSDVSYTSSPVDVPDWARSAEMQKAYPSLAQTLAEHQNGTRRLILASDGWVDAEDFGKK